VQLYLSNEEFMKEYIMSSMMEELNWQNLVNEDDLFRNHYYLQNLPDELVTCSLFSLTRLKFE
jgi:hypothetical protein